MSKLVDIVEVVEPIGSNEWCRVAFKFNKYAKENCRPCRDTESLRKTFDRLTNMKKPTGDSSSPETVRRAKHIARYILSRVHAVSVSDEESDEKRSLV